MTDKVYLYEVSQTMLKVEFCMCLLMRDMLHLLQMDLRFHKRNMALFCRYIWLISLSFFVINSDNSSLLL